MKRLLILLCVMMFVLLPTAVFGETEGEDSGQDSYVPPAGQYTSVEEMREKRIGVMTGSSFDAIATAQFPDAQLCYFNSMADMITALNAGKIDTFLVDEPVIHYTMGENDELTYIPENLAVFDFGLIFAKTDSGRKLCDEMSEYIRQIRSDGTLDQIRKIWFDRETESWELPDYEQFPAENGELIVATDGGAPPFSMVYNNKVVGFDIDIAARFCEKNGYRMKVMTMGMDAMLPSVQSGKSDLVAAGVSVTPERMESVLFAESHYSGGVVLAVLKSDAVLKEEAEEEMKEAGFFSGLWISFKKTFIRENRWKLFLEGLLTTLTITIVSILIGTLLGFLIFLLCRNGNRAANGITRVCLWLVQGMPTVVLLMIFYYIIFGKLSIGGTLVAVICFTLIFAAGVFSLLKTGVGTVDPGQYEAAYALGYSNRRTFFKVILPQALPHVVSTYKGEITGLIKASSVVGYIAVQDLTKMGDIVRSRTYEAFFPLIAVAIIYFGLEGILGFVVGRISRILNPKRRGKDDILKGVNTNDKN